MRTNIIICFWLLGIVDQIQGNTVAVELSLTSEDNVYRTQTHLPLWIFPCEISEGSKFYLTNINERLQLRCDKPKQIGLF
jgi:hypothetical protein